MNQPAALSLLSPLMRSSACLPTESQLSLKELKQTTRGTEDDGDNKIAERLREKCTRVNQYSTKSASLLGKADEVARKVSYLVRV